MSSGPPAAHRVISLSAQPAFGPSRPNGVIETWISAGLTLASASGASQAGRPSAGAADSIRKSALATSRCKRAKPSDVPGSQTTDRLPDA